MLEFTRRPWRQHVKHTHADTSSPPPPPAAWSSAIFSTAADYSAQCVTDCVAFILPLPVAVCGLLCTQKKSKQDQGKKNPAKNIQTEDRSDGGMTRNAVAVSGSPSPRRPQGCRRLRCSPARRTGACAGPRCCCCSPRSSSVASPSAAALPVNTHGHAAPTRGPRHTINLSNEGPLKKIIIYLFERKHVVLYLFFHL